MLFVILVLYIIGIAFILLSVFGSKTEGLSTKHTLYTMDPSKIRVLKSSNITKEAKQHVGRCHLTSCFSDDSFYLENVMIILYSLQCYQY